MYVRPVKRYSAPKLPTREAVDECAELLREVPMRWRGNHVVTSALTVVLALGSQIEADAAKRAKPQVAPIFEHGDGYGSFGCRAINPPVFLTEEEAQRAIIDEAKKAGLSFVPGGKVLTNVRLPVTDRNAYYSDSNHDGKPDGSPETKVRNLDIDGSDKKRAIYFEFVSRGDFNVWEIPSGGGSTVTRYDIINAARTVRMGLVKKRPAGTYAVFYDPAKGPKDAEKAGLYKNPGYGKQGVDWNAEREKSRQAAANLAREELRKQVRDFVKWLKAQGVI